MARKFMVNELAVVSDIGDTYPTYSTFFKENNIDIDLAARYRYGDYDDDDNIAIHDGDTVKILAYGVHHETGSHIYVVSKSKGLGTNYVYLINESGLEPVRVMTYSEIREILGFDFQMVDDMHEENAY